MIHRPGPDLQFKNEESRWYDEGFLDYSPELKKFSLESKSKLVL